MVYPSVPSLTESSRAVLRVLAAPGADHATQARRHSRPFQADDVGGSRRTERGGPGGGLRFAQGRHRPHGDDLRPWTAAGYVIGIDVGEAQVRAVARTLDDTALATVEERIPREGRASTEEIGEVIDAVARATLLAVGQKDRMLRAIAVAVPRIVSTHRLGQSKRKGPEAVLRLLRLWAEAPIILENNVNCAAIAELHYGAPGSMASFPIFRSACASASASSSTASCCAAPMAPPARSAGCLFPGRPARRRCGKASSIISVRKRSSSAAPPIGPSRKGPPPSSAKELFARAEAGSPQALKWVRRHAADIGRLAAACVGMFDPGLIVLGGGVGQNPLVVEEVQRVARELTWQTEIAVSALGANGTALGAMRLAADFALGSILGESRHPAVILPPPSRGETATGA